MMLHNDSTHVVNDTEAQRIKKRREQPFITRKALSNGMSRKTLREREVKLEGGVLLD
jgi:hypothetical protein